MRFEHDRTGQRLTKTFIKRAATMALTDSLLSVIASRDSLIRLAAGRTITVDIPHEAWWQSNLASATVGAAVGAIIVIVAQAVEGATTSRRRKEETRRRLVNEMVALVVQCGVAGSPLRDYQLGAATALAPVELCLAAFDQLRSDLGVFKDPTLSWRLHGWYGEIHGAVAMGKEHLRHAEDLSSSDDAKVREVLTSGFHSIAEIFRLSEKRGKRLVEFVLRADRITYRPRIRRLLRSARRMRSRLRYGRTTAQE